MVWSFVSLFYESRLLFNSLQLLSWLSKASSISVTRDTNRGEEEGTTALVFYPGTPYGPTAYGYHGTRYRVLTEMMCTGPVAVRSD